MPLGGFDYRRGMIPLAFEWRPLQLATAPPRTRPSARLFLNIHGAVKAAIPAKTGTADGECDRHQRFPALRQPSSPTPGADRGDRLLPYV